MKKQLTLIDLLPADQAALKIEMNESFPIASLPTLDTPGKDPSSAFIDNVRRFGIINPLVYVRVKGKLVIKEGRRRLKTAKILEWTTVPIKIVDCSGLVGSVLGLSLNEQRSENPISELRMIRELLLEGANESVISAATGMPRSRIKRRLALQALGKEWRELADRGEVTATVAESIAKLPPPLQKRALRQHRKAGRLTHGDVKELRQARATTVVADLPGGLFAPEAGSAAPTWESRAVAKLQEILASVPAGHPVRALLGGIIRGLGPALPDESAAA